MLAEAVESRRWLSWAFGCVLFELLTGRVTFEGESISDVMVAVLERQPDWKVVPPATPAALVRLLRRCLEKDPKARLRDIGDARVDLSNVVARSTLL